jgi:hypothetical protein
MMRPSFTFKYIEEQYTTAIAQGYQVITCEQYVEMKDYGLPEKVIINRVDIDFSVKKAERLLDIFERLGIKGTFFIRLHAKEYNPFSFESYRIIKRIKSLGHEIGYHSEIVDQAAIWEEDAAKCLRKDIAVINSLYDISIGGVASHGGMTGLNNLAFWKNHHAEEFGLKYEAYDFFNDGFYVSDSEWTQWKSYDRGVLNSNDHRSLAEHAQNHHNIIYALIHSDTYYDRHIYE